ncbi:MAG: Crp/Fnr family transcriptional regulator [Acidobacteria bacterium]|nr:Crp/Fnr family transcriptional regulator [Acidobacteriota bacterium]
MAKVTKEDLKRNHILAGLFDEESNRVLAHLEIIETSNGGKLYSAGDEISHVYFPQTALILLLNPLASGETLEVGVVGHEGAFGIDLALGARTASVSARFRFAKHGRSLRMKADAFMREFQLGQSLHQRMLAYARFRLLQATQRAVCNGIHHIQQRLCRWLLELDDRIPGGQFSITHESISEVLGVSRPEVTRIASLLRRDGAIHYTRGGIVITDRTQLERMACECYLRLLPTYPTSRLEWWSRAPRPLQGAQRRSPAG